MASRPEKFGTVDKLRSGRFSGRYINPETHKQVRVRGTFKLESQAWNALAAIEVDMRRGDWRDDSKGRTRVANFFSDYMATHRKSEVSAGEFVNNESFLRVHLLPEFGHLRIEQLDAERIDKWKAGLPKRRISQRVYNFLRHALTYAVKWGYLRTNPCDGPFSLPKNKRPTWSYNDIEAVMAHVDERYHAPLWVMFAGHLRIGELIALNASDYDSKTGVISVTKTRNHMGETKAPKNGDDKVIQLLDLGIAALKTAAPKIGDAPLFTVVRGRRLSRSVLQRAWRRAVAKAELKGFHIHDMRHVGLSLVAEAGASLEDLKVRGGHRPLEAVAAYQHTTLERDMDIAARTSALLAQKLA